jgi:ABC-type phosphate/phosphonate transport system substrate-binding protein
MITKLAGRVTLLATPSYDAPGCAAADYSSLVIVHKDAPWEEFRDLRGKTCAVNGAGSWSGHHALRTLIALEGGQGGLFCAAIESGSHAGSIAAVAEGRADFAAVDCITHATLSRHKPASVAATRVLCRTPAMPGLPLIAGPAASAKDIAAMREGLVVAAADPELADTRKCLGITSVHFLEESDYHRLAVALRQADAAGVGSLL